MKTDVRYFPDPDDPALAPFSQAFFSMMFAHAEFEKRFSNLLGVITKDQKFGEKPYNRWTAFNRPKLTKKLIAEHQHKHPDGIPEINEIVDSLERASRFVTSGTCLPTVTGGS